MTRPKLLLADDSPTIRKVVELTFADEGIDVSAAGNAEAAMHKFIEIQPDIVLVDVSLAGTSGYKICEMIKADEATMHIPVLLLVGSFEPFDHTEAERVGADGFLTKPFQSIRELVSRVTELLGTAPAEALSVVADSDIMAKVAAEPAPPLTEDIDDLYISSFADTAEIEEFDTVEDALGDSGMDDELIETSYPSEDVGRELLEDDSKGDASMDTPFDWSPESIVTPAGADDQAESPREPEFAFQESQPSEELVHVEQDIEEPLSLAEPAATAPAENGRIEPTPELVSLIAERVIEKLSDHAVREIAREAVPRIAEKLIREALDQDRKG